ncbi:MAG: electron transfer flavoprotein subunit alpha/FixB family protein [Steroidobacteraceae bacterium]|jgi:electron transfer flavoprotein alpha subunit|nr:electron transfer flavoprotein subunit alpha/FixB family protein [Steroidobacteraceae bacterium]
MNKVLVIAEHAGGSLNPATAKCVTCAASVPDAEVTVAVFAADGAGVAAQAAALKGVAKVLLVENAANAQPLAAVLAPQVVKVAAGHGYVFGPSTTFGRDLMPRVAALLGVPQLSDVMAVESATRFKRPVYAGNAITTVEVAPGSVIACTVRVASYESAPAGGNATVEKLAVDVPLPSHTRFVTVSAAKSDRPDLQTAPRVVSGGRALGSAENFEIIYRLAAKLNAGVGASRAAVDAGYAPNEMQVGQTGKIIAPELYVAIGISGAIQHVTGIKDARTIVAINKDPEAPIFEIADIGLVGDLFTLLPEIERLI